MLSTLVAFSIFMSHSTSDGVKVVAYVPVGQVSATQYQTEKSCKKDLDAIKDQAKDSLDQKYDNESGDDADMAKAIERKEIDSMRCKQVTVTLAQEQAPDVPPPTPAPQQVTVPVAPPSIGKMDMSGFTTVWKIGRIDSANVFHGTQYNPATYANKTACDLGLEYAYGQVIEASQRLGANGKNAVSMLDQFKSQYGCVELTVDVSTAQKMFSQSQTTIGTDHYAPGAEAPPEPTYEQQSYVPASYQPYAVAQPTMVVKYVQPVQIRSIQPPIRVIPQMVSPYEAAAFYGTWRNRNVGIHVRGSFGY